MKVVQAVRKKKASRRIKTGANPFTVVAIGASAGGLEAISALLKRLPVDTGMAFIYVQHLSPDHKSMLTEILSKTTKMNVQPIDDMELLRPNNVYVIPHNKGIAVTDGHIKLLPYSKDTPAVSIDVLFSSLALTHKKNVIGVVLSGNARDGTLGLKAIKEAGGLTFAQDGSAQAASMPRSAIASGVVDFVLSPEGIAEEIGRLAKTGFKGRSPGRRQKPVTGEEPTGDMKNIFEIIRKEKGIDFSHYKISTIQRRIRHRMLQGNVPSVKLYEKLLLKKNKEAELLCQDLLINVTGFFRDAETFQYLKNTFLPRLLKSKKAGEILRIWVPACSTGQEAYSIAMLIADLQYNKAKKIPVKIFATDLSDTALRLARTGKYSKSGITGVPKKLAERFFTKTEDSYVIDKGLREMCVFAPHNILTDPPFFKLDFISCRNLLIYFDASAQKKALASMHFALNDTGSLLLGKSETTGAASQLFTSINNKYKIYARKKSAETRAIPVLAPSLHKASVTEKIIMPSGGKAVLVDPGNLKHAIDSALLAHCMPACAIINKNMEILQFRGLTAPYLSHPSGGKANLNILKMMRPEFSFELRNAIHEALKTKHFVRKSGIEIKVNSIVQMMSLEVYPLKIEWDELLLMIVFTLQEAAEQSMDPVMDKKHTTPAAAAQKIRRIKTLTEALNNSRTEMDIVIESQEAAYEELQTANEEIVSSNEELQTLNEELETSKEEIQATNEELSSSNHELQTHNELLTESYELSEAIIATIHEPMLILDKDLRIKSANKLFYKNFHVKKAETEGMSLFELGNNQWDIPKLRKLLEDIHVKTSHFENFEITHAFPEIGERTMLLNAHPIIQKAHSKQLILLAISDVTEKKRAVERLQRNEKRYIHLIESLPVAVYTCDKNGLIHLYNKAAAKLWGRTPQIGKEHWCGSFKLFQLEGRVVPLETCPMAIALKEGRAMYDTELILERPDGSRRFIKPHITPFFDSNGIISGAINMVMDITEQKQDERKQEVLSKYARSLIEASLDPLITINGKGKITDMNVALADITGMTREQLTGTDFFNYFTEAKQAREVYQEVFSKGFVIDSPLTLCHQNGNLTDVLCNGSIYKDDHGNALGVVIVARDVSAQKIIQKELVEAKVFAELATGIAEEAKEKAEQAARIAEEAVKSKQQFLSNMSHEIRTPMNAIIGFTKVILKTNLTAKQKEYLAAIKMSGDALIVLINDILDLAKVDAGKMTFEETPFNMASSLSAMLHLFETRIQEKNVAFVKEYDPKIPPMLVGDPVRLHQIILNLVSNAVKFTSAGTITVSARLVKEDEKNASVEFSVKDTGIGIPEDKIERIFETFHQASSGTARLYGGTGLGLAIVKQLVEQQGGALTVSSQPDIGSTFSFILNFLKTTEESKPASEKSEPAAVLTNIKVLAVEDIALNQLLIKTLLDEFGFERDIAFNGKEAIKKLRAKPYDIILMDLQMPEMNGFEATEYIRNTMKSDIPIIALTADVTTVDLAKCKEVGMNDYLPKPIDEKLLYSKIVSLVKKPVAVKPDLQEEKNIPKDPPGNDSDANAACINLDYLNRRTKSNPALIAEMIQLYLEQTPPLVNAMKQSFREKDWDGLYAAVHKMIPSFAIMGINPDFENMAKNVQEAASKRQLTGEMPGQVLQLEEICTRACKELKDELKMKKYISL